MSWMDEAKCLQVATQEPTMETAWDNVDKGDHYEPDPNEELARRICVSACPVRDLCFRDAIEDPEAEGIRGGYRFHMGRVSSRDSMKIQREFGIKVKVVRSTPNVPDPEV